MISATAQRVLPEVKGLFHELLSPTDVVQKGGIGATAYAAGDWERTRYGFGEVARFRVRWKDLVFSPQLGSYGLWKVIPPVPGLEGCMRCGCYADAINSSDGEAFFQISLPTDSRCAGVWILEVVGVLDPTGIASLWRHRMGLSVSPPVEVQLRESSVQWPVAASGIEAESVFGLTGKWQNQVSDTTLVVNNKDNTQEPVLEMVFSERSGRIDLPFLSESDGDHLVLLMGGDTMTGTLSAAFYNLLASARPPQWHITVESDKPRYRLEDRITIFGNLWIEGDGAAGEKVTLVIDGTPVAEERTLETGSYFFVEDPRNIGLGQHQVQVVHEAVQSVILIIEVVE